MISELSENHKPNVRGSRKRLVVLLISFIVFSILIAIFVGHAAISDIATRGLKTERMDVYIFSLLHHNFDWSLPFQREK